MRRKPEFPTKEAWLARRREPRLEQGYPGDLEQAQDQDEQQGPLEPDERGADRPVITLRPTRPYWR
jgi:hypothetical protein